MDGRVAGFCILLDFVAALRSDGDFTFSLLLGDGTAGLTTAPVPRD